MARKHKNRRVGACALLACVLALAAPACLAQGDANAAAPASGAPAALTQPAAPAADSGQAPPDAQPSTETIHGSGNFVAPSRAARSEQTGADEQGDITLNFVNADVKDVVKAILGDYLKLNYETGANVTGTITIQTSQPLTRAQVLPALDQVLRLNNMALVLTNGIYKVVPLADAHRESGAVSAGPSSRGGLGYGIEVAPVRYVSATEMQKLLEPLAPTQGIIHVDSARNLLIIEGTAEERRTLLADIALFDVDWMKGMSFLLYTPVNTDAQELIKELNQIFTAGNSPIAGMVRLVAIDRLNMVLAVSPQQRYLDQLNDWIARLDRPGQGTDKRIFVYHVQNGRASDIAKTLVSVLFGGQGSGSQRSEAGPETMQSQPADNSNNNDSSANAAGPATSARSQAGYAGTIMGSTIGGMGAVNITADETNNALVILATPKEYNSIRAALAQLDMPPLQVFLEAAIAEVTLTNALKYGVQYFYQPDSTNKFTLSDTASGAITAAFPGFSYMFSNGSNIKVILDALSTVTHIEVVSSPDLLVLNNQTATLQVGDQVPIATAQAVSVSSSDAPLVNSIAYQNTGVILKVTPRVNRGGVVMMDVSQEVSNVTNTTSSSIDSPTIQQRKINSTVAVQDGETIALGGLIMDSRTKSKTGIPYLQEVPLLGALFRDTNNNHTRTELIVLITPHVVDNVQKARAITEELRHKLPAVESMLAGRAK